MTAGPSIDPARFLTEQLDQASPDLMRDLLTTFVNALLSAQADAVCGAGYGETDARADQLPQRLPALGPGHPGRDPRRPVPKLRTG
jgi:putative transposase